MNSFSQASVRRPTRRNWLLAATLTASVLASLDLFVVNLAFTSISASYPEATPQAMSWILNAYGIAFAALLVPSGRLADRFGRLRLFRWGLGMFATGSLVATISPDISVLIGARGLQGVGAALVVPTSLALLLGQYDRARHTRMISMWSASGSVAAAGGPVLGGLLSEYDWRWIFLINVPIAVLALAFTSSMKNTPQRDVKTPDLVGVGLLAMAIGALVAALSYVSEWGLTSPLLWAFALGSLLATLGFIRRCLRHKTPAVDLQVFAVPSFSVAAMGMVGFYVGFAIMLLGGSLYLTLVWAWSPLLAGLGFSVGPGTAVVSALLAGRTRLPPRWLAGMGSVFFTLGGVLWFFFLTENAGYLPMLFGLMFTGAGAGIAQTGFLAGGVSGLPASSYATGTGVLNTSRQIGSALGVAGLIALTGAGTGSSDYHLAWLVMSIAGFVGLLAAFLIPAPPRRADIAEVQAMAGSAE